MKNAAAIAAPTEERATTLEHYVDTLSFIERLHRLLLDVIKDEFERLGLSEINAVQALLLYNIGAEEVTAGELRSRGYYQGSNVSYNLKKLVEGGFLNHERCSSDRRAVRISLTERGAHIRNTVADLWQRHADSFDKDDPQSTERLSELNDSIRRLERFWGDQIRYIY